ncbi:MAG: 2-amino-3,7-dideoxy-D-threo-hept-6-ulosonate synthase [Desertimonas sp.]
MSTMMLAGGKALRLARLMARGGERRLLLVPIDHSFSDGPMATSAGLRSLLDDLRRAQVDGVVMHKGRVRAFEPGQFVGLGLVVHLSGGTSVAVDQGSKVLVGGVAEAVAVGADAVSVHVNIGAPSETEQLRDLGLVTGEASRLGVPVLAMMYARGRAFEGDRSLEPTTLSHLGAIAADAGADIVKLPWAGSAEAMRSVVESCPLPVVAAGGARPDRPEHTFELASDVMISGAAGLAVGRSVFEARDPYAVAHRLAGIVHDPRPAMVAAVSPLSAGVAG